MSAPDEVTTPTVSVVVPCFNAAGTITALVDSLLNQSVPSTQYEILVVDDGSTDDTLTLVAQYDAVDVLTQSRGGPGGARNHGMRAARGDFVLFVDADLVADARLIESHLNYHRDNPDVTATGGAVHPAEQYPLFSWALADHLSSWFNAHPGVVYDNAIEYLPSLNFCIKASFLKETGMIWADGLEHTGEDVAFCSELTKRGGKLSFLPDAGVHHRDRTTLRGYLQHLYRWGYHAPFVRGEIEGLSYGVLFPRHPGLLLITGPLILAGYSLLVWKAWLGTMPLKATLMLPQLFVGRIAYLAGVISATSQRWRTGNTA